MTPAVRIHQDGRGQWQTHDVQLNYSRPQPLDVACAKVRAGGTVFVLASDVEAVLSAAREGAGSGQENASPMDG